MRAADQLTFSRDESIARWREHSISLDRNKRFTLTPRLIFTLGLSPVEWTVFMYYYSLAPDDHPGEDHVAVRLGMGRRTLRQALFRLQNRGMVFFDGLTRNRHRLVNISHPVWWRSAHIDEPGSGTTNPFTHEPMLHVKAPNRLNEAREYFAKPTRSVALPYLLFQLTISPIAKLLYGLICHIGVYDHPTASEFAAAVDCSEDTVSRQLGFLVEAGMLDFTVREPDSFGGHVRYYYHTYDVGHWRFKKAQVWYPANRSSLAEADAAGRLLIERRSRDEHENYTYCDRPPLRLISSGTGRYVLRQSSSRPGQVSLQLGQTAPGPGQVASQLNDEPHQNQRLERLCRESVKTNENKNKENKSKEESSNPDQLAGSVLVGVYCQSKRWNPEARSFSPRIINIAKAASFAWEPRGLRFDPTLWTGFVEDVALERGEEGTCEFAEFVVAASNERRGKLPYDPLVMRRLKKDFLGQGKTDSAHAKDLSSHRTSDNHPSVTPSRILAAVPPNAEIEAPGPKTVNERGSAFESELNDMPLPPGRNPLEDLPADLGRQRWLVAHLWRYLRKSQKAELQRIWARSAPGQALSIFAKASPENLHVVLNSAAEVRTVGALKPEEVPPLPWERFL